MIVNVGRERIFACHFCDISIFVVVDASLVPLQSARLGEGHVAHVANERSYILVAHVVYNQTRTLIKDFVALIYSANESRFIQVFGQLY